LTNCFAMAAERPQISTFRRRNPLEPETPKPESFSTTRTVCPPSSLASWGHIELQGAGLAFGRFSKNDSGSETAFTRPFDCAIYLIKPSATAVARAPCHPGLKSPNRTGCITRSAPQRPSATLTKVISHQWPDFIYFMHIIIFTTAGCSRSGSASPI